MTKEDVRNAFNYWGESIFNPTGEEEKTRKPTIMRSIYAYVYDHQLWGTLPKDAIDADDYLWNAYQSGEIVLEDGIVISWLLTKEDSLMDKRNYDKFAYYDERVKMVRLINNEGEIIEKEGYSVEGGGIFDLEGEEYIAGYTEDGEMHASVVDVDDTVLNLEGERTQYKLSAIGGDTLKKLVTQCLNDWDLPSMKTFEDLVENGIVKEINEFTFEVGGERIKAIGEGSGMYSREWSFEGERTYDKLGAVVFDRDKMLKLIDNDEFLYVTWDDLYADKSEEEKDVGLEVMFNTYVLEDSVMEHEYEHGKM